LKRYPGDRFPCFLGQGSGHMAAPRVRLTVCVGYPLCLGEVSGDTLLANTTKRRVVLAVYMPSDGLLPRLQVTSVTGAAPAGIAAGVPTIGSH
jgi:hypothetical protein